MAAASGITTQTAINVGFEADAAQKLVAAFLATDTDKSGFVENEEVRAKDALEPPHPCTDK